MAGRSTPLRPPNWTWESTPAVGRFPITVRACESRLSRLAYLGPGPKIPRPFYHAIPTPSGRGPSLAMLPHEKWRSARSSGKLLGRRVTVEEAQANPYEALMPYRFIFLISPWRLTPNAFAACT